MTHKIKNFESIANNLGLTVEQCIDFFEDGRIIGRLAEFIFANITNGKRCESENSPYDVDMKDGDRVEVRSITKNGVSFASSKEVGYGRQVTKEGFIEKLDSIDYYVCVDFSEIDNLNFIKVDKECLEDIEKSGIMRKNKSVNKTKFLDFMENRVN